MSSTFLDPSLDGYRLSTDELREALKAIEERFRRLMLDLPLAAYITDVEGRIRFYNPAAILLWGKEPADGMVPSPPLFGIPFIIERPDGSRRQVIPHPSPILDKEGTITGTIYMFLDITDTKNTEEPLGETNFKDHRPNVEWEKRLAELERKNEELKRSEVRHHKMIDEVEDYAILLLDRDGIIMNWNKGAQKIKGYREDEIIGKSFRVFYLPEDRQRKLPEKLIDEASRNGKATHEGWRLRKDGTRFWGSIVITSLHDDQHNIIGFTKVTRDLTEFKIASDQIKDYARELEFQNKELQQFAYAAAHDLKEPLRKVQFYNSAILENAGEALPDRERTFLNNSINSVKRMKGLIDDLLKYAKVSEYLEKFEDVDIKTIVEEIMVFYRDLSGDDIIRAELNALPVISGIPFQIRQLFENLLGNAFKYQHRDRKPVIQITCEKEFHTFVTESDTDSTAPYYKITVQDNGIGFEPEFAQKIFELFHRLHPREEYSGTGVGLAICKRIVQNHKGFIEAASLPDQGSAFTIYLPCS